MKHDISMLSWLHIPGRGLGLDRASARLPLWVQNLDFYVTAKKKDRIDDD
jgi:hypothetical protein